MRIINTHYHLLLLLKMDALREFLIQAVDGRVIPFVDG